MNFLTVGSTKYCLQPLVLDVSLPSPGSIRVVHISQHPKSSRREESCMWTHSTHCCRPPSAPDDSSQASSSWRRDPITLSQSFPSLRCLLIAGKRRHGLPGTRWLWWVPHCDRCFNRATFVVAYSTVRAVALALVKKLWDHVRRMYHVYPRLTGVESEGGQEERRCRRAFQQEGEVRRKRGQRNGANFVGKSGDLAVDLGESRYFHRGLDFDSKANEKGVFFRIIGTIAFICCSPRATRTF